MHVLLNMPACEFMQMIEKDQWHPNSSASKLLDCPVWGMMHKAFSL